MLGLTTSNLLRIHSGGDQLRVFTYRCFFCCCFHFLSLSSCDMKWPRGRPAGHWPVQCERFDTGPLRICELASGRRTTGSLLTANDVNQSIKNGGKIELKSIVLFMLRSVTRISVAIDRITRTFNTCLRQKSALSLVRSPSLSFLCLCALPFAYVCFMLAVVSKPREISEHCFPLHFIFV